MGRLNPSRETKCSGTHGDRGMLIFSVQPTTSRIGNLTRLIHTLLYVMTIHIYIHTHALCRSNSLSEKSALAATPQIGGNPALDL